MIGEILIYATVAISALFITGYAVHMFIGGLVSPEVEFQLIVLVCLIVAGAIGYMVWDVFQRRSGKK
jgi:membrane protein implicated in regulation of membrane protease activity